MNKEYPPSYKLHERIIEYVKQYIPNYIYKLQDFEINELKYMHYISRWNLKDIPAPQKEDLDKFSEFTNQINSSIPMCVDCDRVGTQGSEAFALCKIKAQLGAFIYCSCENKIKVYTVDGWK